MNRLLFALFLPNAPEYLIGDLEEEALQHGRFWLLRHVLTAAAHQSNLLETTAATAFLLGIPLLLLLELRRYALTLIPFRESTAFSPLSTALFALLLALSTAFSTRALGGKWPPVLIATLTTGVISVITNSPLILAAAAFLGGSLATRPARAAHKEETL